MDTIVQNPNIVAPLKSRDEIREEFVAKVELYTSMVGTLYPQSVYRDILILRSRHKEWLDDFPSVPEPHFDGHSPYIITSTFRDKL